MYDHAIVLVVCLACVGVLIRRTTFSLTWLCGVGSWSLNLAVWIVDETKETRPPWMTPLESALVLCYLWWALTLCLSLSTREQFQLLKMADVDNVFGSNAEWTKWVDSRAVTEQLHVFLVCTFAVFFAMLVTLFSPFLTMDHHLALAFVMCGGVLVYAVWLYHRLLPRDIHPSVTLCCLAFRRYVRWGACAVWGMGCVVWLLRTRRNGPYNDTLYAAWFYLVANAVLVARVYVFQRLVVRYTLTHRLSSIELQQVRPATMSASMSSSSSSSSVSSSTSLCSELGIVQLIHEQMVQWNAITKTVMSSLLQVNTKEPNDIRAYPLRATYPFERIREWKNDGMFLPFRLQLEVDWLVDITPAELLLFLHETRVPLATHLSSFYLVCYPTIQQVDATPPIEPFPDDIVFVEEVRHGDGSSTVVSNNPRTDWIWNNDCFEEQSPHTREELLERMGRLLEAIAWLPPCDLHSKSDHVRYWKSVQYCVARLPTLLLMLLAPNVSLYMRFRRRNLVAAHDASELHNVLCSHPSRLLRLLLTVSSHVRGDLPAQLHLLYRRDVEQLEKLVWQPRRRPSSIAVHPREIATTLLLASLSPVVSRPLSASSSQAAPRRFFSFPMTPSSPSSASSLSIPYSTNHSTPVTVSLLEAVHKGENNAHDKCWLRICDADTHSDMLQRIQLCRDEVSIEHEQAVLMQAHTLLVERSTYTRYWITPCFGSALGMPLHVYVSLFVAGGGRRPSDPHWIQESHVVWQWVRLVTRCIDVQQGQLRLHDWNTRHIEWMQPCLARVLTYIGTEFGRLTQSYNGLSLVHAVKQPNPHQRRRKHSQFLATLHWWTSRLRSQSPLVWDTSCVIETVCLHIALLPLHTLLYASRGDALLHHTAEWLVQDVLDDPTRVINTALFFTALARTFQLHMTGSLEWREAWNRVTAPALSVDLVVLLNRPLPSPLRCRYPRTCVMPTPDLRAYVMRKDTCRVLHVSNPWNKRAYESYLVHVLGKRAAAAATPKGFSLDHFSFFGRFKHSRASM